MNEILNLNSKVVFDESITRQEVHTYAPYTSISVDSGDSIIISINQENIYLLLSESFIYVEGKISDLSKTTGAITSSDTVDFVNNGICHLFDEIRLEMNGTEIDTCKNVGITSCMKAYTSFSENEMKKFSCAGWENKKIKHSDNTFSGSIYLKMIFGFAENYSKIILNQKLDLILLRSKNSKDALISSTVNDAKIQLTKIVWRVPQISVDNTSKLQLLSHYKKNIPINIAFRKYNLNYYPNIPQTKDHNWTLKTTYNLERPRFIIFGFQTSRNNNMGKDLSKFDHVSLKSLRVFLNSESFPWENLSLEISKNRYIPLYMMYCAFQESYYGKVSEPYLSYEKFIADAPLIVVDTSRQSEIWKFNSTVDIRVEYTLEENAPANTTLYALIIHDCLFQLKPLTNIVQKMV